MQVEASDGTVTSAATLVVDDRNEAPTLSGGASFAAAENSGRDAHRLRVRDVDVDDAAQPLRYAERRAVAALRRQRERCILVAGGAAPDFEAQASHAVFAVAIDGEGARSEAAQVTIELTDEEDSAVTSVWADAPSSASALGGALIEVRGAELAC